MADEATHQTPPQVDRAAASRAAVAARRERATIKADIASGAVSALAVLDAAAADPESAAGRMRVTEFLTSVPAIGVTKMQHALADLSISPVKKIGGLGKHQRDKLREFLRQRERVNRDRHRSPLVVLAGPTAVGKGAVSAYIREHFPQVMLSVSATTRPPRPGEVDGADYYFVSDAEFDRMIADHELLEWAVVHNAFRYGTPRGPIASALEAGESVLLEIDLQGARSVRRELPDARLIFLLPPSWEELVRRLSTRGTEDSAEQQRRLATARVELAAQDEFDARVVNDDVSRAAQEVVELMGSRSGAHRV